jgi:hypothetical protein
VSAERALCGYGYHVSDFAAAGTSNLSLAIDLDADEIRTRDPRHVGGRRHVLSWRRAVKVDDSVDVSRV